MGFASCPGGIDVLLALLVKDVRPDIQEQAALALGRFSCQGSGTSMKIASYPGESDGLVALLAEDVNPAVQKNAAVGLRINSSGTVESANKITSFPGGLERLEPALLAKRREL